MTTESPASRELSATSPGHAGMGRRFAALAGGEALSRLIAFGVTVFLARELGAFGYGVIALASAVMLYLNCVADAGLDMLGVRDVAADPARVPTLLPSLVGARLLIALVLALGTAAVGLFAMPQPEGAILAAFTVSLAAVAAGTKFVHVGLERPARVALARVAGEAATAILVVGLVRGIGDLGRVPASQFSGDALTALLLLLFLRRAGMRLPVGLDWSAVLPILRRAWPLVVHALLGLVVFNADFIFLRIFRDASTVGRYAAAYALISFFLNLGFAYSITLLPVMTRLRGDAEGERALFGRAMAEALALALPVAAGGWLLADGIMRFVFGAGFAASAAPLRILLWSLPVALMRNVAQAALVARARQDQVLRSVVWAATVNLALNVALIPPFGMVGAATSTLVTETVRTALSLAFVARDGVPLPDARRFARPAAAVLAMGAVVWRAALLPLPVAIAAGMASYATALALLGVLRRGQGGRPVLRL